MWQQLKNHGGRLKQTHLRELFDQDNNRFDRFSRQFGNLLVDFSKEKIDQAAFDCLIDFAKEKGVEAARDDMFVGSPINITENRSVLHVAARDLENLYNGKGADEILSTLEKFLNFAEAIRKGSICAFDGAAFSNVISIGIGGSDLGLVMATKALSPFHDGPNLHYIANVDGSDFFDKTKNLDPKRTLVIIQSKTFTTLETMTNAHSAIDWLKEAMGDEGVKSHLAAVSTNLEATKALGIDEERVFGFWDWIGGRYSIWAAIGLPLAIAIGAENFRAFLAGGREMDQHFKTAPLEENIPVLLGLIGIWRRNILNYTSTAIIPYDERLSRFPAYLQQLMMESNGKSITRSGEDVSHETCPVIWGEAGTNAQHSFFQMLHQGTDIIPVDFLIARRAITPDHPHYQDHHNKLIANCFAQSQALAFGKSKAEVIHEMKSKGESEDNIQKIAPHRVFKGDRPSTTLLYDQLTPKILGQLIALYEHKTFVEGIIWNINSFDQWGVELGKVLAQNLQPFVEGKLPTGFDSSTTGLLMALKGETQ